MTLSISRILTVLAGALIGAVVFRRRESAGAGARPWSTDLEALQSKFTRQLDSRDTALAARLAEFRPKLEAVAAGPDARIEELAAQLTRLQPKIEALAVELAPKLDPRVDELSARLAAVESKANSTQSRVDHFEQKLDVQDQKLQATNQTVVAIEQMLADKMAGFERTLQAMNSSIAQSDELLERVLDLVQSLTPVAAEPREPVSMASGGGETRELQR
jgi:chromosome segregation ATPase